MRKIIVLVICTSFFLCYGYSQNVGQKNKDNDINYEDINGKKQGKWVKKYPNENIAYEANFINDVPAGKMKRYYKGGRLMAEIDYDKKGKGTGYGVIYYDNEKKAGEGKYININVKDSIWKFYGTDGALMLEEKYKNGKKDGLSTKYYRTGSPVESVEYKDDVQHGIWTRYNPKGVKIEMAKYENGERNGYYVSYYPNMKVEIKGQYAGNLPTGKWEFYDVNGKLKETIVYRNGKPVSTPKRALEYTKMVKEMEEQRGKIPDPEDFMNNPSEYMRLSR